MQVWELDQSWNASCPTTHHYRVLDPGFTGLTWAKTVLKRLNDMGLALEKVPMHGTGVAFAWLDLLLDQSLKDWYGSTWGL